MFYGPKLESSNEFIRNNLINVHTDNLDGMLGKVVE